ncbi:AAA family ATPase [Paenibacillus sp. N1-5-1-14]|uniref:AAA family ATPase n=1 Tax=Paenibacillus radicibacter TaxID=2972488 RepID=UPI0021593F36|nr:AAA family ATPase [Paenibacillus radicibacter]MCR8643427.1 AAA family ATPase [Paenibacillus radicibacter]
MIDIIGYQMIEAIVKYGEIAYYRLMRLDDRLRVILKTTCDEYPRDGVIDSFRYEYEMLTKLGGKGALEAYEFEIISGKPYLFLLDTGGDTLQQIQQAHSSNNRLGLQTKLSIAVAIADSLMQMHRAGISMHVMTPVKFLVNVDTSEVKFMGIYHGLLDTTQPLDTIVKQRTDVILPYIAPEQTGRTGLVSDYRADFYSLGIILYEWFAGSLPFEGQDVLDMVYHHLAIKPELLHHRNPSIPSVISLIIDKCLAKNPEDRYASAYGVKYDLEMCLSQIENIGAVESFQLAGHDIPEQLMIPTHYYGRALDQQKLIEALGRASNGQVEVVRVKGQGGMGKTTFIEHTFAQAISPQVRYVSGKFTLQYMRSPYDIWVQMIEQLVDQVLMESKLQMEVWKLRILEVVDGFGQLLINLVPKLELLVGRQASVQTLPPIEAKQRLHRLLNRFIQLFIEQDRTLVMFFDDLQWADDASLQYLAYLLEDKGTRNLLIVLAYRESEWNEQHPLHQLNYDLSNNGIRVSTIDLKSMHLTDVKQLLRDAMRYEDNQMDEIAKVLLEKTDGNPFYMKQLLQDLIDQKRVVFEQTSRLWIWDLASITAMNLSDNATEYMANKINYFPKKMRYALGIAACLGSEFTLQTLTEMTGYAKAELSEMMKFAVQERLLQVLMKDEKPVYQFLHDRIEQAASLVIAETERPDIHLRIGTHLVQQMKAGRDVNLFEVVTHMNQALARMQHADERMALVELNLQAALKAKQSTAYETALRYLHVGTSLLEDSSWDQAYSLTFELYRERAEAEYLCSNFDEASELFELLLSKAKSSLDKAIVCNMMIQFESSQDNYEKVIALGQQTMDLLGIRYDFQPSNWKLVSSWLSVRRKLQKLSMDELYKLPPMTDQARKVAMSALVHVGNACFYINKKGWIISSFTMIEMTLEYGMVPEAAIGFIGYAMFLYFRFNQYEEVYKWGMFACQISKSHPHLYVKTLTSFALCHDSWRYDRVHMMEIFNRHAGKVGLESGDLWQSNQSILINSAVQLQFGHPLEDIYNRVIAESGHFLRHNNQLHYKQAAILAAILARLIGKRSDDDPYMEMDIESTAFTASVHGDHFHIIEEFICILHYLPGYIMGNYEQAYEALEKSGAILASRKDGYENFAQITYESLVMAQLYTDASLQKQQAFWRRLKKHRKSFQRAAKRCPEHYLHKYLLIQAEMVRLTGKRKYAEQLYEQSIEAAHKYKHIHDLAFAAELLGRFGLEQGKEQLAKIYLTQAYEAYLKWGAMAKAADMEQKYGHLLHIRLEKPFERVDSLSLIMSTQALSGEVEMNDLLQTLMRIMLHNAGAEYGVLLFHHQDNWIVEVHGTADVLHIESITLEEDSELVPAAIIAYATRTREEVVLHDAAKVGMFAQHSFVRDRGLKSVLCLPIMNKNKLIGVLYLENKLASHVFTPQRLEVLKLLASQCAISIENARLYSRIQHLNNSLEDQVRDRTRSLERSMRETFAALAEVSVYEERNRIAQEIHDIVGHTLTSTILQIEAGKRLMRKDMEASSTRLKEAQDLVRHSLNEIRGSVHMLKEDKYAALTPMLEQLLQDTERNTGVTIEASIQEVPGLSMASKKTIYHALQEGLTNGIRHGGSSQFIFKLEIVGSDLQFRLVDQGKGASSIVLGFGLKVMTERVEQIGGSLSIECGLNRGCQLKIDLPYPMHVLGDDR